MYLKNRIEILNSFTRDKIYKLGFQKQAELSDIVGEAGLGGKINTSQCLPQKGRQGVVIGRWLCRDS